MLQDSMLSSALRCVEDPDPLAIDRVMSPFADETEVCTATVGLLVSGFEFSFAAPMVQVELAGSAYSVGKHIHLPASNRRE